MTSLPPDDYAAGASVDRILQKFNADLWEDAADALIKAIPLCADLTAEDALRRMAKVFRDTGRNAVKR